MMALQNIETLKMYNVKNIVTTCPHCFNTLKNEYTDLGADYEVVHHTEYLEQLISSGKLKIAGLIMNFHRDRFPKPIMNSVFYKFISGIYLGDFDE